MSYSAVWYLDYVQQLDELTSHVSYSAVWYLDYVQQLDELTSHVSYGAVWYLDYVHTAARRADITCEL